MIDRRTATWAELKEEKERMDALWRQRKILDAAYILSLNILGFSDREAKDELAGLKVLSGRA